MGINAQGSATAASAGSVKKVPLSKFDRNYDAMPPGYDRPDITIAINNSEIDQKLSEKNASLRDVSARAHYMNHALKQGLRKAVIAHEASAPKITLTLMYAIFGIVSIGIGNEMDNYVVDYFERLPTTVFLDSFLRYNFSGTNPLDRKLSAFTECL